VGEAQAQARQAVVLVGGAGPFLKPTRRKLEDQAFWERSGIRGRRREEEEGLLHMTIHWGGWISRSKS